jgi:hypothetical protein
MADEGRGSCDGRVHICATAKNVAPGCLIIGSGGVGVAFGELQQHYQQNGIHDDGKYWIHLLQQVFCYY